MTFHVKICVVFWLNLYLGAYCLSATPMHYKYEQKAAIQTILTQQSRLVDGKKTIRSKAKRFSNPFNKKHSAKQLKPAKRKLLWTWFKRQFKPKKKLKKDGLKVEFWSLASFFMAILALAAFIAALSIATQAGLVIGLIFYGILGVISFLFRKRGRRNIALYPNYYKGKNLTKWAKGIILAPIIALLITLVVILVIIL